MESNETKAVFHCEASYSIMRYSLKSIKCVLIIASAFLFAGAEFSMFAQEGNPSKQSNVVDPAKTVAATPASGMEGYAQVYRLIIAAEKKGWQDPKSAILDYEAALSDLQRLKASAPHWQYELIDYRVLRIKQSIAKLKGENPPNYDVEVNPAASNFADAYNSIESAKDKEKAGDREDAIRIYEDARKQIQLIHERHPNWQPFIVGYRLGRIEEAISRLRAANGR